MMKSRYAKGELAKEIMMLFVAGGLVATCVVLPGMAHVVKMFEPKDARERQRLMRAFNNLRKQGYVMRLVKDGKEEYVVTRKGAKQVKRYLVDGLKIVRPKKWNKKWHVVMFDIPDSKKIARQEISLKIKDIGMYAIQESVFVSPFPCKSEIDFLATHYGVEKHLVYLEANTVISNDNLMVHFGLKT